MVKQLQRYSHLKYLRSTAMQRVQHTWIYRPTQEERNKNKQPCGCALLRHQGSARSRSYCPLTTHVPAGMYSVRTAITGYQSRECLSPHYIWKPCSIHTKSTTPQTVPTNNTARPKTYHRTKPHCVGCTRAGFSITLDTPPAVHVSSGTHRRILHPHLGTCYPIHHSQ